MRLIDHSKRIGSALSGITLGLILVLGVMSMATLLSGCVTDEFGRTGLDQDVLEGTATAVETAAPFLPPPYDLVGYAVGTLITAAGGIWGVKKVRRKK